MSLPGFVRDVAGHEGENWRLNWSETTQESQLIPAAGHGPACSGAFGGSFPIACAFVQLISQPGHRATGAQSARGGRFHTILSGAHPFD